VDATLLTLLVVQAFGAAALGRLRSLPIAYLGAIGSASPAAVHQVDRPVGHRAHLARRPAEQPAVHRAVHRAAGQQEGQLVELTRNVASRTQAAGLAPGARRFPTALLIGLVAVALVIPSIATDSRVTTATTALAMLVVFASLSLLLGLSRQISLCTRFSWRWVRAPSDTCRTKACRSYPPCCCPG